MKVSQKKLFGKNLCPVMSLNEPNKIISIIYINNSFATGRKGNQFARSCLNRSIVPSKFFSSHLKIYCILSTHGLNSLNCSVLIINKRYS